MRTTTVDLPTVASLATGHDINGLGRTLDDRSEPARFKGIAALASGRSEPNLTSAATGHMPAVRMKGTLQSSTCGPEQSYLVYGSAE